MKKIIFTLIFILGVVVVSSAQQDTTLAQYVGKYKFPDGSVVADVAVTIDNGALVMGSSAGNSTLEKESEEDRKSVV